MTTANENAIPRTWECFRAELELGMQIDESVKISDHAIIMGKYAKISVVAEPENGTLLWSNTISVDGVVLRTCGYHKTIHEAYHDARAALAGWFIFNSMDYLGLEDSDTLGAM